MGNTADFLSIAVALCAPDPFLSWTERGSMSTNVFDGSITRHQFHSGPLYVIDDKDLDPDSWTSIALDRRWTKSMIPTRERLNRADSIVTPPSVYWLRGCLPTPMGGLKSILRNHIVSGFPCHVSRRQGCILITLCSNFIIFTHKIFWMFYRNVTGFHFALNFQKHDCFTLMLRSSSRHELSQSRGLWIPLVSFSPLEVVHPGKWDDENVRTLMCAHDNITYIT